MPIERKRVGTGMTRRTQVRVSTPIAESEHEEVWRLFRVLATATLEGAIAPAEVAAQQILAAAGLPLPVTKMVYLLPDGSWVDDLQEPVSLTPGHTVTATTALSLVEKRYGIDSPEWYAAEILWCIKQVRDFWAQGKNERAVLAGIWLGSLMAEADLKVQWDKPAMSGDKFYASGQKSVQTKKGKAATRYEKIRVMADAYRTMHPTARDTQIAAHIYRTWHPPEDRPSERTIRRAISNRHLAR